ncbi:MAG: hypothetical protein LBQ59_03770 [Candidatus Peribacteria bacterium]|nr:hypothetical protein [Candidatus Peribacteria bacterium]
MINNSESKIYVDYIIHQYPEDKTLVEPYSNGMTIKREIFEVLDENLLSKCSEEDY